MGLQVSVEKSCQFFGDALPLRQGAKDGAFNKKWAF